MNGIVTADRGFTWSDEETALLLDLWGGNDAQYELTGQKRNFVVYEKISETMTNMGFVRTASQCREKIKRMKREYTLTKRHNKRPGEMKKSMRFFEQFEKVLFEKQKDSQKEEISSKEGASEIPDDMPVEVENSRKVTWSVRNARKLRKIVPKNEGAAATSERNSESPWTPDVLLIEENTPSTPLYKNEQLPQPSSENDEIPDKRQKVSSRMSVFKCAMDSLTLKFMKYQTEADSKLLKKFDELENERSAMNERVQKMWLDFEERQRASERQHELEVMNIFQGIVNGFKEKPKIL